MFEWIELNKRVIDMNVGTIVMNRYMEKKMHDHFPGKPCLRAEFWPSHTVKSSQVAALRNTIGGNEKFIISTVVDDLTIHDIELSLRAFKKFHALQPNSVYLLTGGYYPVEDIKNIIRKYDTNESILWRGSAGWKNCLEYLSLSDICVHLCSESRGSFPDTVVSAIRLGVPLVVYNRKEYSYLPVDCSYMIEFPGQENEITDLFIHIASSPEQLTEIRSKILNYIRGLHLYNEIAFDSESKSDDSEGHDQLINYFKNCVQYTDPL